MARPPGTWVLTTLFGFLDQKEWSNDFWWTISAGTPPSNWDEHAAAGAFHSAIATPLLVLLGRQAGVIGTRMYYNDGTGTLGVDWYQKQFSVSSTGCLPEDVAVVVQKTTNNHTKGGRGRWYFAGADETNQSASYLTPTGITAWQALATALKTAVVDQGITYSPAHFSPKLSNIFPITNTPLVALLATRRRRRFQF